MQTFAARPADPHLPPQPQTEPALLRWICGIGALAWLLSALSMFGVPLAPDLRVALVAACLTLAAMFGAAARQAPDLPHRGTLRALGWMSAALIGALAFGTGHGVQSLNLAFLGLLVCLAAMLLGRKDAVALALAATALVAALAAAEMSGVMNGRRAVAATPLPHALVTQCLLIGLGLFAGLTMARAATRAAQRVAEREQRFDSLLGMAVDSYWELDAELRVSNVIRVGEAGQPDAARLPIDAKDYFGRHPWDVPGVVIDPQQLTAHLEDLRAHRPFTELHTCHRDVANGKDGGQTRYYSVSGTPRHAADGRFLGYWGVDRNITRQVEAAEANAASEARFRDVFESAPAPLVLHRDGLVIEANPASAALFGFADVAAMRGFDFKTLYADDEAQAHVRARLEALERLPLGAGLPVADSQMRALDQRRLAVQASAVRVAHPGGPASLSIFVDLTERAAAEAALRRSQRLLATLFDANPDGIALTELGNGRYVAVNENFARMLGYRVGEVVGQSSLALGIWAAPADRAQLVDALGATGRVVEMPALLKTRHGDAISVSLTATRVDIDGVDHVVSTLRDVTKAERLRREHAAVFHSAVLGIALTRERSFQLANPRFHAIFGWPPGGLIGQPGAVLWPDPEAFAAACQLAEGQLLQGRALSSERLLRRHDGSEFWCRLQGQTVDPDDPVHGGTVWLAEDITERRQLDQSLATARDAAEDANRAKSAFLTNTSHELRTPLNGLVGMARLAAQHDLPAERRQQYLAQIVDSAQSLASIINDILDLSKIEAGKISVENLPFDLHALLHTLHHGQSPLAEAGGLTLALQIDPALPDTVRGDALRVRQIMSNFIANALKFTHQGTVTISARPVSERGPAWLRLAVADTGPGIATEVQQRLFTPFTQGDDSTTRRYGGTGLGLAICRDLAGLMGGTVGLDSAPGQGSVFWAELPLPADAPPVDPAAAAAPRGASQGQAAASANTALTPEALSGMRVLVVEDNPVNMMIVIAMLDQWGALGSEATDGVQAISAVNAAVQAGAAFDAVLMDVQMPRMSGHEAARLLRREHPAQRLPIIALTAAALVSERDEAQAAGMNEFLTKPIDATRLLETLRKYAPAR